MADDPGTSRKPDTSREPGTSREPAAAPEPAGTPAEPAGPLSLIYLDVDDEITSAAARIRAAAADEVALVLPFGSRLATSRINFRLLAREAAARGKRIEIVCADASARALAVAAGLPTHTSVAAFEAHRRGDPPAASASDISAATASNAAAAALAAGARRRFRRGRRGSPETTGSTPAGAAAAAGAVGATGAAAAGIESGGQSEADDTQTRVLASPRHKSQRVPIVGPPRPPVRTGVAIGVGLAVIASIVAAGLLALEFLPSATITLHPRAAALGPLELTVEAREDVTAPDGASMTIPARRFTFTLVASQTFPATGIRVEEVKATGSVTFSNFDTGRGVLIPKGTILRTDDGIEFATLSEVTLPRARVDFFPPFPVRPSTASADVEAVEPGPDGNVGNNTIVNVPQGGRNLRVTNEEATTGGTRDELPEVSAADVEAAKEALTAALAAELDRQVAAGEGIPAEVTLFPTTRSVGEPEFAVDPESLVGTADDAFDLAATADGVALGVDPAPIQALAEARIGGTVTPGWTIQPGSVVASIGTPAVLGTSIVYPVTIAATEVRDVDQAALLAEIRGVGLPEAHTRLDDFGDVVIDVWPEWVTKIPTRVDRVTLQLAEPQASAAP